MFPTYLEPLRGRPVTIVALGDSNTEQNHWTCGSLCWAGLLSMGLHDVFPQGACVINSGRSGDSVPHGMARLERDVFRFAPDLVIVGYGANDCFQHDAETFREQLDGMVVKIRETCGALVILRTPTPMMDMMTGLETHRLVFVNGERVGDLAAIADAVCAVGRQRNVPVVDHYRSWKRSMESSCRQDLVRLMGNPQHPNAFGHRRLYHELAPAVGGQRYFYHDWERVMADTGDL